MWYLWYRNYRFHRTAHRSRNGPGGMDRGPSGPHNTCATNRKQRVDMQGMWRQGSLRHPGPPLRRLLIPRIRASVWEPRVTIKLVKIPAVASSRSMRASPTAWWSFGAACPALPPEARRRSTPPQTHATDAARYVCEAVARGKEEHIAPETRATRDCSVPTGEGGIHLRGYAA